MARAFCPHLGVAVVAGRRHLRTTPPRVERVVGPFDRRVFCHNPCSCRLRCANGTREQAPDLPAFCGAGPSSVPPIAGAVSACSCKRGARLGFVRAGRRRPGGDPRATFAISRSSRPRRTATGSVARTPPSGFRSGIGAGSQRASSRCVTLTDSPSTVASACAVKRIAGLSRRLHRARPRPVRLRRGGVPCRRRGPERLDGLAGARSRLQAVLDGLRRQEHSAKAARRGLWRGEFIAPRGWLRKGKRLTATFPAARVGERRIKGNISRSGTRIYHVPGRQFYDRTRINTSKDERWFCSEAEARAAGWRRAKR